MAARRATGAGVRVTAGATRPQAQRPFQSGLRFSTNERGPSA